MQIRDLRVKLAFILIRKKDEGSPIEGPVSNGILSFATELSKTITRKIPGLGVSSATYLVGPSQGYATLSISADGHLAPWLYSVHREADVSLRMEIG